MEDLKALDKETAKDIKDLREAIKLGRVEISKLLEEKGINAILSTVEDLVALYVITNAAAAGVAATGALAVQVARWGLGAKATSIVVDKVIEKLKNNIKASKTAQEVILLLDDNKDIAKIVMNRVLQKKYVKFCVKYGSKAKSVFNKIADKFYSNAKQGMDICSGVYKPSDVKISKKVLKKQSKANSNQDTTDVRPNKKEIRKVKKESKIIDKQEMVNSIEHKIIFNEDQISQIKNKDIFKNKEILDTSKKISDSLKATNFSKETKNFIKSINKKTKCLVIAASKKEKGYRLIIPLKENKKEISHLVVRVMNEVGVRNEPYFRIQNSNYSYYDCNGQKPNTSDATNDPVYQEKTHHKIDKNLREEHLKLIEKIKNNIEKNDK